MGFNSVFKGLKFLDPHILNGYWEGNAAKKV